MAQGRVQNGWGAHQYEGIMKYSLEHEQKCKDSQRQQRRWGSCSRSCGQGGDRTAMGRCGLEARGALHCVWSHPRQIDDIEGVTALSPSMWDY